MWRNDQLTSIDVAYMNHREIIALSNNNNSNVSKISRSTIGRRVDRSQQDKC
jgi:hypothetical protein